MRDLSLKEIEKFSNKILEDYDNKIPSSIFKEKKKITNEEALLVQSNVAKLRQKRGEEIIGYKIGCVSKDTQKKMGFNQPASGYLWNTELHKSGATLNKKDFTNPAMEAEFGVILNRDIKPELVSGWECFTYRSWLPFKNWKRCNHRPYGHASWMHHR